MAGISSIFPVGIQSTRDAIGENYSSFVANQFLVYIVRNGNDPEKSYGAGTRNFWEEYIYPAPVSGISETIPSEADETAAIFSASPVEGGIYTSDNLGLYRVKQGDTNVTDFHATIRIWKSTIQNVYLYSQTYSEISYEYAVNLNIEISWPVEKNYNKREKRYYCVEIFKQSL